MRIMVLNDGETYTDLAGCKILDVPNDWNGPELDQGPIQAACSGDDTEGIKLLHTFGEDVDARL